MATPPKWQLVQEGRNEITEIMVLGHGAIYRSSHLDREGWVKFAALCFVPHEKYGVIPEQTLQRMDFEGFPARPPSREKIAASFATPPQPLNLHSLPAPEEHLHGIPESELAGPPDGLDAPELEPSNRTGENTGDSGPPPGLKPYYRSADEHQNTISGGEGGQAGGGGPGEEPPGTGDADRVGEPDEEGGGAGEGHGSGVEGDGVTGNVLSPHGDGPQPNGLDANNPEQSDGE